MPQPPVTLRGLLADEAAFDAWYRDAMPRVYAYLCSRCGGDAALAEDLTQLAFTELVRRPDRWRGESDLVTWVISIARNKLVDHYRRRHRDVRRQAHLLERLPPVADPVALAEADLGIRAALDALPPDQRLALVLRAADGLSVREVAVVLRRSTDATDSLIRRARSAFRAAWKGDADD